MRRKLLFICLICLTWTLLGCRLVNLLTTPTPEPTFAPIFEYRPPLKFSPEQLPEAKTEKKYSAIITISDNLTPIANLSIETGVLPPGLELQEGDQKNTVEISGIPELPGKYTFTLAVGCFGTMVSGQSGTYEYTLIVK